MAATPVAITSYSAEIARVGRKPQFNGLPASLYQDGKVPAGAVYMTAGALVKEPGAAVTREPKEELSAEAS